MLLILRFSLLTLSQTNLLRCIDQARIEINLPLPPLHHSIVFSRTQIHKRKTKMLINCTLQGMIDGDLCFAFAVVIVPQHEGWTPEHKPMIFFPSSPMPLSLNNSICIHQSCICHSWYVLQGSLPRMLCSRHFDSPHSVQDSRDQSPHG